MAQMAESTISFSDFVKNRQNGLYVKDFRVVVHHTEGSIKIPENKFFPELLKAAALRGGYTNNILCHTLNFVNEDRKNRKKLIIYCKEKQIAQTLIDLKEFKMSGHTVQLTADEDGVANKKEVIKKIDVSGAHVETLEVLIDYLHDFAEFSNDDIKISTTQLNLSITVKNFIKIVPQKRVFSKGKKNHTVFIKTTGYGDTEFQAALSGRPLMADLFKENAGSSVTNNAGTNWLGDNKRVIPADRPRRVVICNYCNCPGHTRYDKDKKVQCPELKQYINSLKCYKCGENGHKANFCKKNLPDGVRKCFKCGEEGHEQWEADKCRKYKESDTRKSFRRKNFSRGASRHISVSSNSSDSEDESEKSNNLSIGNTSQRFNDQSSRADDFEEDKEEVGIKNWYSQEQTESAPVTVITTEKPGAAAQLVFNKSSSTSKPILPVGTEGKAKQYGIGKTSDIGSSSNKEKIKNQRITSKDMSREAGDSSKNMVITRNRALSMNRDSKNVSINNENENVQTITKNE